MAAAASELIGVVPTPPPEKKGTNWVLIGAIGGGLALIAAAVVLSRRGSGQSADRAPITSAQESTVGPGQVAIVHHPSDDTEILIKL